MVEDKIENGQEQETTTVENNAVVENKSEKNVDENKSEENVVDENKSKENVDENKSEKNVDEKASDSEVATDNKVEEKPESEEKTEPTPELLKQIKDQIEYYFGNVNMQRDKFLNMEVKLDNGWIPLSVMLTFKILASMSKDTEVILKALEDSDLIEVSEDKKKIRRSPKHPLPVYDEEYKKSQQERSVYIKGFSQENTTIKTLKEFLAPYEPIEHIFMRRYKDKNDKSFFKGSIFVQFTTLEAAKSFMELESVKYNETELIRKWSKDYTAEKAKEKEEIRAKRDKKKSNNKDVKSNEQEREFNLPKGAVLHLSGLSNDTSIEDIKEEMGKLDEVNIAFIEYSRGNPEALVRLQDEDSAKDVITKLEDINFTLKGNEITCRVVEGEEEETYLEKVKEDLRNIKNRRNYRSRGGRRGGKRGHSPSRNENSRKKSRH